MAMLGRLEVGVFADTADAARSLASFGGQINKFASSVRTQMRGVQTSFARVLSSGVVRSFTSHFKDLASAGETELDGLFTQLTKTSAWLGGEEFRKGVDAIEDLKKQFDESAKAVKRLNKQVGIMQKGLIIKAAPQIADYMEGVNSLMSNKSGMRNLGGMLMSGGMGMLPGYLMNRFFFKGKFDKSAQTAGPMTFEEEMQNALRRTEAQKQLRMKEQIRKNAKRLEGELATKRLMDIFYPKSGQTGGASKLAMSIGNAIGNALSGVSSKALHPFDMANAPLDPIEAAKKAAGPSRHPLNRLIDANSREGFAALRANMRQKNTLEEQGKTQIDLLKDIKTNTAQTATEETISIPGGGA